MALEKIPLEIGHLGIVREVAVDEILTSPESVELAINLDFDRIGAAQLRDGLTLLVARIAGASTQGMINYRNNAGDTYRLLAKVAGSVYAFDGTNWTSVRSGLSNSSKARFTNFIDLAYMVDGNSEGVVQTFNGTTFGTGNVASLQKGDFIENYRSRIWIADNSTDKLFFSNVVTTSQTITGGTSFIQISPQDGERITALKRHPRALLVFKENHIYRVFSTTSSDPDPSIQRGTYSQESVIEAKDGIYYHHPTGFYKFVFDGDQREISRPIIDVIEAIPRNNYENISGWTDSDHLYWSVGDITLKGEDLTNIVCRYTISTQVWTLYSYSSEIRNSALYDDGTLERLIVGDENGDPFVFDSGTTDDGDTIFYDLQTHPLYLTNAKMLEKDVTSISIVHENAQGAMLSYQVDGGIAWKKIGSLTKNIVQAFTTTAKFKKIRLRFSGNSIGSSFIFRGFELLMTTIEGLKRKR